MWDSISAGHVQTFKEVSVMITSNQPAIVVEWMHFTSRGNLNVWSQAGAVRVEDKSSMKQSRERERQQSNSGNNCHSPPRLKPLSYCDTQRNYGAETGSATYPSHPTQQQAVAPQQLLLSWNRCQHTSTSSGADAVTSAITNHALQNTYVMFKKKST